MKEIKWIFNQCENSLSVICTALAIIGELAILPIIFWGNYGWCAGILSIIAELLTVAAIAKWLPEIFQDEEEEFDDTDIPFTYEDDNK